MTTNAGKGVDKRKTLYIAGENVNWKPLWKFLDKVKRPYDPARAILCTKASK